MARVNVINKGLGGAAASCEPTITDTIESLVQADPGALCCSLQLAGASSDYTRREFWDAVCHYADVFSGLPAGAPLLMVKNLDFDLLAAFIGAIKAGVMPAQLSPPSSKVNSEEYLIKLRHACAITSCSALFIDESSFLCNGEHGLQVKLFTKNSPALQRATRRAGKLALIQFSSGSTGLQKGVVLSHAALLSHMDNFAAALQLTGADAIASWLPLYHDMGLIACYLMPLCCGIPFHMLSPFEWVLNPDSLLDVIERRRATICYLPNFSYHLLAQKSSQHDLSSVRLWINCSEPARERSHHQFLEKFTTVARENLAVCYALAENTFAATMTRPGEVARCERGVVSCGVPVPGVELAIFAGDTGSDGEVGIKSPFMFEHFLDKTRPLRDGFYLTGDLGFMDQGELFITGRKKDLIIVHGKNIYPQDAEFVASSALGAYPGRCVAFGIFNDEVGSEDLYLIVERQPGAPVTPLKLSVQKKVLGEVGLVPRRVEVVEHMTLVKTTSGKISRSRNRELYLNGGFQLL